MKEITKLDDKYHVMKIADIEKYLTEEQKTWLSLINTEIRAGRIKDNKNEWNDYVVLNLDDEIDIWDANNNISFIFDNRWKGEKIKVGDIAVALVNAILKAKEGQ